MTFKELTEEDKQLFRDLYKDSNISQKSAQQLLSEKFQTIPRTVRKWAKKLEIGIIPKNITNPFKILIYDIETSRIKANVWWTGKQYVGHQQLTEEPKIISIAWKWLGDDNVKALTWDKNHLDKKMLEKFLEVYNSADMVIGQNNDKFDNRWVNARAMKFRLEINTYIKSFDIMKQAKRLFRLPSYSMKYLTEYLGVETKLQHEGIIMWEKIQDGTKSEQKEYLAKMVDYNKQDIVATEHMYLSLRKYMGHKVNFGALKGGEKFLCPNCGGDNINLYQTVATPAGTIQRIMVCKDDRVQFKLSNREYIKYMESI